MKLRRDPWTGTVHPENEFCDEEPACDPVDPGLSDDDLEIFVGKRGLTSVVNHGILWLSG